MEEPATDTLTGQDLRMLVQRVFRPDATDNGLLIMVDLPDERLQRHYDFVKYLYGAGSRPGAPPMPLQGVWTADSGSLPPWKGDYHNDLNTQMTYMGYQAAGHFDEGACYLDFLWDRLPRFRRFAREFYGTEGAAAPGVMSTVSARGSPSSTRVVSPSGSMPATTSARVGMR